MQLKNIISDYIYPMIYLPKCKILKYGYLNSHALLQFHLKGVLAPVPTC